MITLPVKIKELIFGVKALYEKPSAFPALLDGELNSMVRSAWRLMSIIQDPSLWKIRFRIERCTETQIDTSMQCEVCGLTEISKLGEFTLKAFWTRNIPHRHIDFALKSVTVDVVQASQGRMTTGYFMNETDQQIFLSRLYQKGDADLEFELQILNSQQHVSHRVRGVMGFHSAQAVLI